MSTLTLMLFFGATNLTFNEGEDRVKTELKKLEGTWQLVRLEVGGKILNVEGRYERRIFSGTKLTVVSGHRVKKTTFTIDPVQAPMWIDCGAPGIYELKGNTLRMFIGPEGARPTEFKTKEGTLESIATYEWVSNATEAEVHKATNAPGVADENARKP
jgi:uncharacterized protein (TIGR03067 family)